MEVLDYGVGDAICASGGPCLGCAEVSGYFICGHVAVVFGTVREAGAHKVWGKEGGSDISGEEGFPKDSTLRLELTGAFLIAISILWFAPFLPS